MDKMEALVKNYRRLMQSPRTLETEIEMKDIYNAFERLDSSGVGREFLVVWQKRAIYAVFILVVLLAADALMHLCEYALSLGAIYHTLAFAFTFVVIFTLLTWFNVYRMEAIIGKAVGGYRIRRIRAWFETEMWK